MAKIHKVKPDFSDERGTISRVLDLDPRLKSVLLISSKKGAVRANHYHLHDIHYTYLLSGKFEYYEKRLSSKEEMEKKVIKAGDMIVSPAKHIHAMKFLEDSTMLVFSTEPRDQKHYEKDTVRLKLI